MIPEKPDQPKLNSIKPLPESYTNIPPMLLPYPTKNWWPNKSNLYYFGWRWNTNSLAWTCECNTNITDESQGETINMNISLMVSLLFQLSVPKPPAIVTLLSLFRDGAHSSDRSLSMSIQVIYQWSWYIHRGMLLTNRFSAHGQMSMGTSICCHDGGRRSQYINDHVTIRWLAWGKWLYLCDEFSQDVNIQDCNVSYWIHWPHKWR